MDMIFFFFSFIFPSAFRSYDEELIDISKYQFQFPVLALKLYIFWRPQIHKYQVIFKEISNLQEIKVTL